jgi:hypothetical protein
MTTGETPYQSLASRLRSRGLRGGTKYQSLASRLRPYQPTQRRRQYQPINSDLLRQIARETREAEAELSIAPLVEASQQQFETFQVAEALRQQNAQDFDAKVQERAQDSAAAQAPEGLLPRIFSAPLIGDLVKAGEWVQNNIWRPGMSLAIGGAQAMIPGQQRLERAQDEAAAQAKARGESFLSAVRAMARVGEQPDMTPSIAAQIPFRINLPSSIFGPGRSFQKFQLGIQGLGELLLPLPFEFGVGRALTKAAKGAGVFKRAPSAPAFPKDGVLEKLWNAQAKADTAQKAPRIISSLSAFKRRLFSEVADEREVINAETGAARKQWRKTHGTELPEEFDADLHAALIKGSPQAGIEWGRAAQIASRRLLGEGTDPYWVDQYVFLKHQENVVQAFPDRQVPGGLAASDIAKGLEEIRQTLGDDGLATVSKSAQPIFDLYKDMLGRMRDEGIVSNRLHDFLRSRYPHYNPLDFLDGADDAVAKGKAGPVMSVDDSGLRRLTEVGTQAAPKSASDVIYPAAIRGELIMARNRAARSLVEMLRTMPEHADDIISVKQGVKAPRGMGEISFFRNGSVQKYHVPSWAAQQAKGMAITDIDGLQRVARAINAPFRAVFTEYNPGFMAANSVFDTLTVGLMQGVMPHRSFMAMYRNLRALTRTDDTLSSMLKSGGDVAGWHGPSPEAIMGKIAKTGNIGIRTIGDWGTYFKKPFNAIRDIGHALELGPRRAVFEAALERGSSTRQAALLARRSTVDFQRAGRSMRVANSFFLYLNPAVQGAMLPWRAMRDSGRARLGLTAYAAASYDIYQHNRNYPEYADVRAEDKYGRFTIMLPSNELDSSGNIVPHHISIVPMLREFAIFSAPITYLLGRMDETEPMAVTDFLKSIAPNLNPVEGVMSIRSKSNFAPTEIASLFNEIRSNYDSYRDEPIVPADLQGLPPEQQFDEFTSETAKLVGSVLNWSPKLIDHAVRNGAMLDVIAMLDASIRRSRGEDVEAQVIVSTLEDIKDNFPADEYQRQRRLVWNQLDKEMKQRVRTEEMREDTPIPFASSIKRRFYRKHGGQLYRSGLVAAARRGNIPLKQLAKVRSSLGQIYEENFSVQQNNDELLGLGRISGEQWRDQRSILGKLYAGTVHAEGIEFPSLQEILTNSQVRGAFYDTVYTVAGSMKDRRTEGALLYAAYRTIPVDKMRVEGEETPIEDWDAYSASLEQFHSGLTPTHRKLLAEEIASRDTALEREFTAFRDAYRSYWELARRSLPDPVQYQLYRAYQRSGGPAREAMKFENSWLPEVDRAIRDHRMAMRRTDAQLDALLLKFGYVSAPAHETTDALEQQLALQPWQRRFIAGAAQ